MSTGRHTATTGGRLLLRRSLELAAALLVAALAGWLTFAVFGRIPFAEPSWLPETFGGTLAAIVILGSAWLLLRKRTGERTLWLLGTVGPAVLASGYLTMLLSGTPHYLFGLGGDQLNRVSYVARFADSPALRDVFYADAAPFYPPQWFWVGGRLAWLFGDEPWQFYKVYSIVTMAVAGAVAFAVWRWIVPTRVAVLLGATTSIVGVHTNAYEPYSWILICLLPQVVAGTVLLCRGLISRNFAADGGAAGDGAAGDCVAGDGAADASTASTRTSLSSVPLLWPLTVAVGVYLGWAALSYTLIAGFASAVVGLVMLGFALWVLITRRGARVATVLVVRLAVIAAISAVLALLFWHKYLLALLTGAAVDKSVASDFAPRSASLWPLPMFEVSALGVLCLIGVGWIVAAVHHEMTARSGQPWRNQSPSHSANDARSAVAPALGVLAVAVIGWFLLSGLRAALGQTLLAFRMIPVMTLVLALAGVLGALALFRWAAAASPLPAGRVRWIAAVVAILAAVQMVQYVTEEDVEFSAAARSTPAAPTDVLDAISEMTPGRKPSDLVLLTSDPKLTAYRPFFTYQAPAQAYAAPTGRYEARLAEIRRWSRASTPAELAAMLVSGPVRGPDVLVLDRAAYTGDYTGDYLFPATINVMPVESNNSREDILFATYQFADPALFEVREVGSRVVIVRR